MGFGDFDVDGGDGGEIAQEGGGGGFGEGFNEIAAGAFEDGADGFVDGAVVGREGEVVGATGGGEGELEADGDFEGLAVGFFLGEEAVVAEEAEAGKGEGVCRHEKIRMMKFE
jgi:hypothetical protein